MGTGWARWMDGWMRADEGVLGNPCHARENHPLASPGNDGAGGECLYIPLLG